METGSEPSSATIGDDALKGPDELLAISGPMPSAMTDPNMDRWGMPAESTTLIDSFPTALHPPDLSWGLVLIVTLAVVGALAPVVVFVGTATRLSAARREQRLATLRLVGATNRQMSSLAIGEALVATIPGALAGVGLFLLTRPLVAMVPIDRVQWFADSISPPAWQALAVLLVVQLLGVATAVVALRRLAVSPLGVARHAGVRPLSRLRLLPLILALVGFAGGLALATAPGGRSQSGIYVIVGSFVAIVVGIALAGPWVTEVIGRLLHRVARGPSLLIAAGRLRDAPRASFGAISGVVLAVFVASAFFTILGYVHSSEVNAPTIRPDTLIVDLNATGSGVPGPDLAGVVGVPGVRTTAQLWQVELGSNGPIGSHLGAGTGWIVACDDIDPVLAVAPCPSGQYAAGFPGWTSTSEGAEFVLANTLVSYGVIEYGEVLVVGPTDVPASVKNGTAPVGEVLVGTDGDPASIERARTALEVSHPDWVVPTLAELETQGNSQLTEVGWIVVLGTIGTLLMAGCSLAVAVAGGLVERRRPLALLRLTGMPIRRLRSVVMLEAAPPLLVAAVASAVLGIAVADVLISTISRGPVSLPDVALLPLLVLGIVLALGIVALTFPLLGRVTSTEQTRFE